MSAPFFILLCSAATYLCRIVGVVASGKVRSESAAFRYATCVTYAIIAALILRMVMYPAGLTAESSLLSRLLATVSGLAVYLLLKRNVAAGAWSAAAVFVLINELET